MTNTQTIADLHKIGQQIRVACQCGHAARIHVDQLTEVQRMMTAREYAARCRCSVCGRRGGSPIIGAESDPATGFPRMSAKPVPYKPGPKTSDRGAR